METAGPSCSKPISTFPGLIVNKIISCHGTIPGLALIVPQATRSRLKIYLQSAQSLNRRVYFLSECLSRAPSAIIVLYCTTYTLNLQFELNKHEMKFCQTISSYGCFERRFTLTKGNARNDSTWIFLQWPNCLIDFFDKTQFISIPPTNSAPLFL